MSGKLLGLWGPAMMCTRPCPVLFLFFYYLGSLAKRFLVVLLHFFLFRSHSAFPEIQYNVNKLVASPPSPPHTACIVTTRV